MAHPTPSTGPHQSTQPFSLPDSVSVGTSCCRCESRSWAWCSTSEPGTLSPRYASSIFRLGNSGGRPQPGAIVLAMCARWRRWPWEEMVRQRSQKTELPPKPISQGTPVGTWVPGLPAPVRDQCSCLSTCGLAVLPETGLVIDDRVQKGTMSVSPDQSCENFCPSWGAGHTPQSFSLSTCHRIQLHVPRERLCLAS